MKTIFRKTSVWIWIAFVCALLLRILILSQTHHDLYYTGIASDSGNKALNLSMGYGLASGGAITPHPEEGKRLVDPVEHKNSITPNSYFYSAHEVPGYAIMLAASWKIFGQERYIYLQILQIILDSLMVFFIFWIGKKLIHPSAGLIAAFLFAFFIPEARSAAAPLRDVWPVFTTVLVLAILVKTQYLKSFKKRLLWYAITGAILGIGILIHPIIQYLNIFLALALLTYQKKKEALIFFGITTIMIYLILSPWILRNYQLFHKFIPTRDAVWQGVWEGWGEFPDKPMGAIFSDRETYYQVTDEYGPLIYGTPAYNDALKQKSLKAIKKYPGWVIGATLRRIPKFFFTQYHYPPTGMASWIIMFMNRYAITILLIFALIGGWVQRNHLRKLSILLVVPLYFCAGLILLHVEARYVLPAFIPYFLLVGGMIPRQYGRT